MSSASLVSVVVTKTVTKASASASATSRANPQGGVLEGSNPSVYDSKNPIILFIIQVRSLPVARCAATAHGTKALRVPWPGSAHT